jgi:uncharacterized protein (DUF1810 family)
MPDLHRFREAQDSPHDGFDTALAELRAGRKRSHWIWYVFPQLAGLGQSSTAVHYGIAGADEAAAYLRDDVLGDRLATATAVVRDQLSRVEAPGLEALMGSRIDALKLVSSMTLFVGVARRLAAVDPRPRFASVAGDAETILAAAARQGCRRCAFTDERLESDPRGEPSR